MTQEEIRGIVLKQRTFFLEGSTLSVDRRISMLGKLKKVIETNETVISEAIRKDLGKSPVETYMCETGIVLSEINFMLKNVRKYAAEKNVPTPLVQFCSRSYKKPSPYGVVLIMSPWNYPFLLSMGPLVDAIAAGNTVVLKPSAYSPETSKVIGAVIATCFEPEYVSVITGGRMENQALLKQKFDYIFFTGSKSVGKEVLRHAADYITPVTLELGGKSPCIVDKTADLKLSAKRIVFGKFLNCGQTCVAPDYVYCDRSIKDQLVKELKKQIRKQYGAKPLKNPDYGKIINEKHFIRLFGLIDDSKVVCGGHLSRSTLQVEPTIMDEVTFSDKIMQEEIFGPILPILTFDHIDEAIQNVNSLPHPLALYIFSSDKKNINKVMGRTGFGGGCVNDCIIHLATTQMGFGGFGESGMGAYHGKTGFDTFTHYKSIVDKKTWLDLPMRYQPYRSLNDKLIHKFLK